MIRDNLTLNVIDLVAPPGWAPIRAIHDWQAGGVDAATAGGLAVTATKTGHGISRASMAIAASRPSSNGTTSRSICISPPCCRGCSSAAAQGSLVTTLAGFAVAYLLRPLGAIVFGHIGDRFGRRRMMLASMAVMTMAMLATALLPTYAAIGPAAGWLLLLLRCVMGFSVGGEYTGVVAYLLEGARADTGAG